MKRHTAILTDLEGAALAVVARDGPTTSYVVAREFSASPAHVWSGSAGAIYPLMRRLEARRLIAGEPGDRGQRSATKYAVTKLGRVRLESWLLDVDRASGMGFDPLRTRLEFLTLAPGAGRQRFLDAVAKKTAELGAVDAFVGKPASRELHDSWLAARLQWLQKLGART